MRAILSFNDSLRAGKKSGPGASGTKTLDSKHKDLVAQGLRPLVLAQ